METAFTPGLLTTALVAWLISSVLSARVVSKTSAVILAGIRAAVPLVYFSVFWDGSWTFLDDFRYISHGQALLEQGYTPVSVLLDPDGFSHLRALAGGSHFLYSWWNLTAMYFFGPHYYSPVFMNILLTFVAGLLLEGILKHGNFAPSYRKAFFVFFMLHWDVVAWSSFINLKDILVMTLTAGSLFLLISLQVRFSLPKVLGLYGCVFLLLWIRYYVPVILLSTAVVWALFHRTARLRLLVTLTLPILPILLLLDFGSRIDSEISALIYTEEFSFNLIRFALSPQPWSIDPSYSYLVLPSILHWILVIPALLGSIHLWRTSPLSRFPLIYLAGTMLLYSLIPELQGPRHRLQLAFILAWMQFDFLWSRLAAAAGLSPARARGEPTRPAWDRPGVPTAR